jgi:hypothetical protein
MIQIKINGKIIQEDRKAQRDGARAKRGRPTRIIWEDKTEQLSYGAKINGTLHVICRPGEDPYMEIEGSVSAGDPKPCLGEPKDYVHIYIDQVERANNRKSQAGVPAIVARWNGTSRYASEVIVKCCSEIAYGCWPGF